MSSYTIDPVTSAPIQFLESRSINLPDPETRSIVKVTRSGQFDNIPHSFAQFIVAGIPGGIPGVHEGKAFTAHECVLHWCTKTMSASMISGRLKQQIIVTNVLQNSGNTTGSYSRVPEGFDGDGPQDDHLSGSPSWP